MHAAHSGSPGGICESRFVRAFDQIPGFLKFNRKEERRRDIDPADEWIRTAATGYLICPEVPAGHVGLPIEKVMIVLTNESAWIVNHVRRGLGRVINDRHRRDRRSSQRGAGRIAEAQAEGFIPFNI